MVRAVIVWRRVAPGADRRQRRRRTSTWATPMPRLRLGDLRPPRGPRAGRGPEGDDHARARHPGLGVGGAVGVPALHRAATARWASPATGARARACSSSSPRPPRGATRAGWICGRCTTSPTSSTTSTRSSRAWAGASSWTWPAVRYRKLWYEGWKAIAQYDPANRDRVLFGETAAISSPLDTLYAALCLDENGKPFRGRMKRLHGCTRPRRLPIGGIAHHPYNNFGAGQRLHQVVHQGLARRWPTSAACSRLMRTAERRGRIPRGRPPLHDRVRLPDQPARPQARAEPRPGTPARSTRPTGCSSATGGWWRCRSSRSSTRPSPRRTRTSTTPACASTTARSSRPGAPTGCRWWCRRLGRGTVEVWGQVRPGGGPGDARACRCERGGRLGHGRHAAHQRRRATSASTGAPRPGPAGGWSGRRRRGEVMRSRIASAGRRIRYLER